MLTENSHPCPSYTAKTDTFLIKTRTHFTLF